MTLTLLLLTYMGDAQDIKFATTDLLWWRGLVRILEEKGFLREGDEKVIYQIIYTLT